MDIFKRNRREQVTDGIVIWADKTAHLIDVEQDITLTIRTIKGMRKALGLEV